MKNAISRIAAYFELLRPELIIMDLTLPMVASFLAVYLLNMYSNPIILLKILLVTIGAFCAIVSSYVFNDFVDIDIDRVNLPKRPLPSKRLKPSAALIYSILLLGVSIVIFSFYSLLSVIVVITSTVIITSYSAYFKRKTPLSFIPVGIAYGLVPIGVWLAYGKLHLAGLLLAGMICATDWGFTLSGVSRDIAGDERRGAPTMPVVFGIPFTSRFVLVCWIIGIIFSIIIWRAASLGWVYISIALISGSWLLWMAFRFVRKPIPEAGGSFFIRAANYRSVLFIGLIVDIATRIYRR
ncbi:UbiA family prenyltransferase [candidate division WOR-3 bacterium]|nr:UbiA family prenyltransferase [candidate division WOR-3 bacterium]